MCPTRRRFVGWLAGVAAAVGVARRSKAPYDPPPTKKHHGPRNRRRWRFQQMQMAELVAIVNGWSVREIKQLTEIMASRRPTRGRIEWVRGNTGFDHPETAAALTELLCLLPRLRSRDLASWRHACKTADTKDDPIAFVVSCVREDDADLNARTLAATQA